MPSICLVYGFRVAWGGFRGFRLQDTFARGRVSAHNENCWLVWNCGQEGARKGARRLSPEGAVDAGMKFESVEYHRGPGNDHRLGHPAVEADAQAEQPQQHGQIRFKRAEHGEEEYDPYDKVNE